MKKTANKQELRKLEENYVNNTIDNLEELIQAKKDEMCNKLIEYQSEFSKEDDENTSLNPIVVQQYFFKSINPIGNTEPIYNAEKLAIVWELYSDMVLKINMQIGEYIPTLTSFCNFIGVRLSTFKSWKNSVDPSMRIIVEKISDVCYDSNVAMAQTGRVKERSTIYRMKSENEVSEKEQPQINIFNQNDVDMNAINKRLKELEGFNKRKAREIEVEGKKSE